MSRFYFGDNFFAQEITISRTCYFDIILDFFNPFHGVFRYPLKTQENIWFSVVFRGYRKRPVACPAQKLIRFRTIEIKYFNYPYEKAHFYRIFVVFGELNSDKPCVARVLINGWGKGVVG